MNIGWAIDELKQGRKVRRAEWEPETWIAFSPGAEALNFASFWSRANRDFAIENGGTAPVLPCVTMKTRTGYILMGWMPSTIDLLSTDYVYAE